GTQRHTDARVPLELRHHSKIASRPDFRCSGEPAFRQMTVIGHAELHVMAGCVAGFFSNDWNKSFAPAKPARSPTWGPCISAATSCLTCRLHVEQLGKPVSNQWSASTGRTPCI